MSLSLTLDGSVLTVPTLNETGWDRNLNATLTAIVARLNLTLRTLSGSATWDPGNLVDGAGETSAGITVTGAAFGDFVVASAPYDLQGITCTAYVSAADTVKIRLQNETGGAIDLASGTWHVRVLEKP